MEPRNIRQMLVMAMWIGASTIPMATPTGGTSLSGLNAKNDVNIICPDYCTCTTTSPNSSIAARCTKMIDEKNFGSNVEHFVLERAGDISLGRDDFRTSGLDHVKSIGILQSNQNFNLRDIESFPYHLNTEPVYKGTLNIHSDIFQYNSQLNYLAIYQFKYFVDNSDMTGGYLFNAPSLDKLLFSVSEYESWSPLTFTKMSNLTNIYLQSPKFKIVPGLFKPLRGLRKLEIYHANSLNNIGQNDFIDVPTLEELVIGNHIITIHEDAFTHLPQLKQLDIRYNEIISFTENHLRNNPQLEVLRMSYNSDLKRLPAFKLNGASTDNYKIHQFDCRGCGLQSITVGTFDAMPALRNLNLGRNSLTTLPRGFFKPLISLRSLDLSRNLITNIPTNMFEGANKLSILILRGNPITTLEMKPFSGIPELMSLDLSECKIKTWTATSPSVNSLKYLSISKNELDHITVNHLQTLPNMSRLELLFNPINCDEFGGIISWSRSHNVTTQFFAVGTKSCIPNGGKTCWSELQKFMCNPDAYYSYAKNY